MKEEKEDEEVRYAGILLAVVLLLAGNVFAVVNLAPEVECWIKVGDNDPVT